MNEKFLNPFEAVTIQYQVPGANWALILNEFPEMVDMVTPEDN